jgi:hypothetical protein
VAAGTATSPTTVTATANKALDRSMSSLPRE